MEQLWIPAHRQGRITTVQRWLRWLEDQGGIERHPALAVQASLDMGHIGQQAVRAIGMILALMSWLIAMGFVVVLSAVSVIAWPARGLSFTAALKKLRRGGD